MTADESSAARPREGLRDSRATQLVAALLTGLVMLAPFRAALSTRSYGGLFLWVLVAVVGAVLLGLLLVLAGVRQGGAVTATAVGVFQVVVVIGMALAAKLGDPPANTALALQVGIPAAAITAPIATALVRIFKPVDARVAAGALVLAGMLVASVVGPATGRALTDAREDAEKVHQLEATGVTPYVPRLRGLTTEYEGPAGWTDGTGRHVGGYELFLEDPSDLGGAFVTVDVLPAGGDSLSHESIDCDLYPCEEKDGYTHMVDPDHTGGGERNDGVFATRGDTLLIGGYVGGTAGLPSIDEIGKALVHAEKVDWGDLVDMS